MRLSIIPKEYFKSKAPTSDAISALTVHQNSDYMLKR